MTTQTTDVNNSDHQTSAPKAKASARPRLFFVDNLRIGLTILVILHHLSITYGAPGDWYYQEGQPPDMLSEILLTIFVAVNQSFFMGFFFMISGYFTPSSYNRKGPWLFLKDRLLRLGIPILFFVIILAPLLDYMIRVNVHGFTGSIWQFLSRYLAAYKGLQSGPMWFIQALLLFNILYVLWRWLAKSTTTPVQSDSHFPGNLAIAGFAFALAILSFVVRIWLPMGWNFELLNLQFPFFPQYIALFIMGLIAYHRNWFLKLSDATGKLWLRIAISLIILFPIIMVVAKEMLGADIDWVRGGGHWLSFVYAVWEQFLCVALVIGLLFLFRKRYNYQGNLARVMSVSAYTAYIIHPVIAVALAFALSTISLYPLIKFPLIASIVIPLCFLLGNYIRKLPLAKNIL